MNRILQPDRNIQIALDFFINRSYSAVAKKYKLSKNQISHIVWRVLRASLYPSIYDGNFMKSNNWYKKKNILNNESFWRDKIEKLKSYSKSPNHPCWNHLPFQHYD